MQKDIYDKIINFLRGSSWAIVLFGALFTFKFFFSLGFSFSLFLSINYIFVSLLFVLLLDAFSINRARLQEEKKQTELLEKLSDKLNSL